MGKTELRDGDIYRWSWINPPEHEPYWCKTRLAIAQKGKLFDLFRVHHGSKFIQGGWGPTCSSDYALPGDKIETELLANIHDMDEIPRGDERYYDPADVVDLRHSNNSSAPIYIKRGAVRNADKIAERIRQKISEAEYQRRSAEDDIRRFTETLRYVEDGGELSSVWF